MESKVEIKYPLQSRLIISQEEDGGPINIATEFEPTADEMGITKVQDLPQPYFLMYIAHQHLKDYLKELEELGHVDLGSNTVPGSNRVN